jgi:hypothetical protein
MDKFTDFMNKSVLVESYGGVLNDLSKNFASAVKLMEGSGINKDKIWEDLGVKFKIITEDDIEKIDLITSRQMEKEPFANTPEGK